MTLSELDLMVVVTALTEAVQEREDQLDRSDIMLAQGWSAEAVAVRTASINEELAAFRSLKDRLERGRGF